VALFGGALVDGAGAPHSPGALLAPRPAPAGTAQPSPELFGGAGGGAGVGPAGGRQGGRLCDLFMGGAFAAGAAPHAHSPGALVA
jgi:hypothetical protein